MKTRFNLFLGKVVVFVIPISGLAEMALRIYNPFPFPVEGR